MTVNIFIHVGLHKSASTFLQERVFPNLPMGFYHIEDNELLDADNNVTRVLDELGNASTRLLHEIREEFLSHANDQGLILSSEELCGQQAGYDVLDSKAVCENMREMFPCGKVLIIIRNQIDYILSIYCYTVTIRGEEYRTIKKFLEQELVAGLSKKLRYDLLIKGYCDGYGADNVVVLPYELLRSEDAAFSKKLAKFFGRQIHILPADDRVNKSAKEKRLILFCRILNSSFVAALKLMCIFSGKPTESLDATKHRYLPFPRSRFRYYRRRRRLLGAAPAFLKGSDKFTKADVKLPADLEREIKLSNERLHSYLDPDIDLASLGYLVQKRKPY